MLWSLKTHHGLNSSRKFQMDDASSVCLTLQATRCGQSFPKPRGGWILRNIVTTSMCFIRPLQRTHTEQTRDLLDIDSNTPDSSITPEYVLVLKILKNKNVKCVYYLVIKSLSLAYIEFRHISREQVRESWSMLIDWILGVDFSTFWLGVKHPNTETMIYIYIYVNSVIQVR